MATSPSLLATALRRTETALDGLFSPAANPLRHAGALAIHCFWLLAGSGVVLYVLIDTSVSGAYHTVAALQGRSAGGLSRSVHRYAADALLLLCVVHLLRELILRRYRGARWYDWISGLPLPPLIVLAGMLGYWLPWDQLAQFSALASAELLDGLGIFLAPVARNFQSPAAINDRLFSLFVFLHLGVPLLGVVLLWAHLARISRAEVFPARSLALGSTLMLAALALWQPARSGPPADLTQAVATPPLDWFLLFVHPLADIFGARGFWLLSAALALVLLALPWLGRSATPAVARVSAANCTGCRRCIDDCPHEAITLVADAQSPGQRIVRVNADNCLTCGLCVGSCPAATPFRRQVRLQPGIDLPDTPLDAVREAIDAGLARLRASPAVLILGCAETLPLAAFNDQRTVALALPCAGMWPPAFVEYALRSGADGVLLNACRGCAYRLGNRWLGERLHGQREPHLRAGLPPARYRLLLADAHEQMALDTALADFRQHLARPGVPLPPFSRKMPLHVD